MERILTIIDYRITITSLSPVSTLVILESQSVDAIGITKEDFIYNFRKLYNRSSKEYALLRFRHHDMYYDVYITHMMISDIIDDLIPLPVET